MRKKNLVRIHPCSPRGAYSVSGLGTRLWPRRSLIDALTVAERMAGRSGGEIVIYDERGQVAAARRIRPALAGLD